MGQISVELKQHYQVEGLEDVRVIKDRQSRESTLPDHLPLVDSDMQDNPEDSDSSASLLSTMRQHSWIKITLFSISTATVPDPMETLAEPA